MSFPRYPAYKPSGVEWLGEVPVHWEITKLDRICKFESGKAHEPFIDDEGEFICVNSRFISTEGKTVKNCRQNLSPALRNDVLAVMSDLPNGRALGKAFFVEEEHIYAVNQRVCRLTPVNVTPRLLFWLVNRNPGLLWFDDGVNQTHIPNSGFTKLIFALPGNDEQCLIATFLDHETAKIDALIAEQQRLIELLQEKRQAVISQAVTKGLNPDAPMKDSGVEWLGEVPEHWEVGQLRRFTKTVRTGRTPDESDFVEHDDFIPWFTPGSFNDATLTLETAKHVSIESVNEGRANIFSKDAVLVVGIGATLGKVGIPGDACSGNQQINGIESSGKLMPRFLGLFLSAAQEQMRISSNASTLGIMNQQKTKELVVNCPPLVEQEQIVFHTEKALRWMLEMSEQCQRVVELLQERRSALISAAVTGQIDVRGMVPETEAA